MVNKTQTNTLAGQILGFGKRALLASAFLAVLYFTGLISGITAASQWALLQTGLRDADGEVIADKTQFDYEFTIKDLEGNRIPFDQFKGKVVFLNLWATWCGPCRAEMPGIQNLYDKVDHEKIIFVMLSVDDDTEIKRVSDYVASRKFTFKAYLPSGSLPELLRVPSIPTTFVISKEGHVVKKEVGSMRYDTSQFQKFLEELSN